mgnify:CR=1 FL=1
MSTNAQDRYATPLVTKKLPDGKVVFRSARPISIKPKPLTDIEITASDVLRMDKLARNAYGSVQDWWVIASANGRVDGSLFFRPGSQVVIPSG